MRKGRLVLQSILFLMAVLASNGCSIGAKDEPMPLSQENIEKYASAVNDAAKKIDMSAGTFVDKMIKAYKEPMEKGLGYNFDKSFRGWLLKLEDMSPATTLLTNLIAPATIQRIYEDSDEALKKGLISQRTYEIINMKKKLALSVRVNDDLIHYLEWAVECQQSHNNACSLSQFIETLNIDFQFPADTQREELMHLLDGQAHFDSWGSSKLVLKPDGSEIDTHSLFLYPTEEKFVVNKEKLELAKKYNQITKEELASVGKK